MHRRTDARTQQCRDGEEARWGYGHLVDCRDNAAMMPQQALKARWAVVTDAYRPRLPRALQLQQCVSAIVDAVVGAIV